MKRTVFSDIDGTLLNSEQRITQKTKYALGELKKNGIPFVIVSARSPGGIFSVMKAEKFFIKTDSAKATPAAY